MIPEHRNRVIVLTADQHLIRKTRVPSIGNRPWWFNCGHCGMASWYATWDETVSALAMHVRLQHGSAAA